MTSQSDLSRAIDEQRAWLVGQSGMEDWPTASRSLEDTVRCWLETESLSLFDRSANDLFGDAVARVECRLWTVWHDHWLQASELLGLPVCGFEVANLIQSGRGFRNTSSGDLAAAASYELGGNPFRETVLVEAVLQEIPAAIRRFDEQEIPRMLESLRNDIDRGWVEFALKDRGVLKNYRGRSGLSRFISGVARQKQKKIDAEPEQLRTSIARLTAGVRWNLLLDICDESQYRDLQAKDEIGNLAVRVEKRVSQLEGRLRPEQVQKYERSAFDYQSRMMQAIDSTVTAPSTECISLLSEELLAGFAQQQARSRLAVKLRFIDNMTFPDIGMFLGVDQGTAHRIVNKTLEQVRDTIFRTDNEEVKRCWQQLSSNRGAGGQIIVKIIGLLESETEPVTAGKQGGGTI